MSGTQSIPLRPGRPYRVNGPGGVTWTVEVGGKPTSDEPAILPAPGPVPVAHGDQSRPMLAVRGLQVRGDDGELLLTDADLYAMGGEVTAITGLSGSGKSTFARALAGIGDFTADTITALGHDVREVRRRQPHLVALVPQFDRLNPVLTVRQSLRYTARLWGVPRHQVDTAVERVLTQVDLLAVGDARVGQLSGGQKKRVSLAAALTSEPPVLLLDEPTTGLDALMERDIFTLLNEEVAPRGVAVVVVTHAAWMLGSVASVALVGAAEQRVTITDRVPGTTVAQGAPQAVLDQVVARSDGTPDRDANFVGALVNADRSAPRLRRSFRSSPVGREAAALCASSTDVPLRPRTHALASRGQQARLFLARSLHVLARTKKQRNLLLGSPVLACLVLLAPLGLHSLAGAVPASSEPRTTAYFLAICALTLGFTSSVNAIVAELEAVWLECHGGLSVAALVSAKVGVSALVTTWQAICLTSFWALEQPPALGVWPHGVPSWLDAAAVLWSAGFASSLLGLAISSAVTKEATASLCISIFVILQLVLAGAFLSLGNLRIVAEATPAYWSFNGLAAVSGVAQPGHDPGCEPAVAHTPSADCRTQWAATAANLQHPLEALAAQGLASIALATAALRRRTRKGIPNRP